jgi:ribosomal protein S18 acetylase RimI-like enzyme
MNHSGVRTIRRGRGDDLVAVLDCDTLALTDVARREALERWIERDRCLVAEGNDGIVGFLVLEDDFFGYDFIALVSVRIAHRRQGVASRLLEAAERECRTGRVTVKSGVRPRVRRLSC